MHEITHKEALRQAVAPVGQALKETEARCTVLGQFINDREAKRSKSSACSHALRERHELHGYRSRLMRRHSQIQHPLDYRVGESPSKAPLPPPPNRPVVRVLQQTHVQARRWSSGR
jgi:hypothetical protein